MKQKEYTRICAEYHSQFAGFRLPVGAVYGRIGTTMFVSLYRNVKRGQMSVFVKKPDSDWSKKLLPVGGEVCSAILNCVEENGAPVVGTYEVPGHKRHKRRPDHATAMPIVEAGGKRYRAFPTEMTLPDRIGSKELHSITPNMRGANYEFNARMRPDRATYGVDFRGEKYIFRGTEAAEEFCRKNGIPVEKIKQEFIYNEANELAYKQVTTFAYWENLGNAASGKASVVAAHALN